MARTFNEEQMKKLNKITTTEFKGFVKVDKIFDRQEPGVEKSIYARLCRVYDPNPDADMISSLGSSSYRNGERMGLVLIPVRDGITGSIVCDKKQLPQDPQILDARVVWEAIHGNGEMEEIAKEIVDGYKGEDFNDRYYTVKENGQESVVFNKEHVAYILGPASELYAEEIRQADIDRKITPKYAYTDAFASAEFVAPLDGASILDFIIPQIPVTPEA